MFISKSKPGLLYIYLNIEIEYYLIFFYYYDIFLSIDNLTVVEELIKISKIGHKVLFIKNFKYFF